jgi:hypothetical protein
MGRQRMQDKITRGFWNLAFPSPASAGWPGSNCRAWQRPTQLDAEVAGEALSYMDSSLKGQQFPLG